MTDSKPSLIHHHFEGETLLQHLAWRQTNLTYYIQQKPNASVIPLISWCQCLIRQRGLFWEAWQLISAVRPVWYLRFTSTPQWLGLSVWQSGGWGTVGMHDCNEWVKAFRISCGPEWKLRCLCISLQTYITVCVHAPSCTMCTHVNKWEHGHDTSAAFIGIMKKSVVMVEKDKPLRCPPQTVQPQSVLVF